MKPLMIVMCLILVPSLGVARPVQIPPDPASEVVEAITQPDRDLRMTGTLFLAQSVTHVKMVMVVVRWGNGPDFYRNDDVRRLAASVNAAMVLVEFQRVADTTNNVPRRAEDGGGEALLQLIQQLGRDSNRPEIADAPLLFWGHSAAGPFGAGFAALYPKRTIAFIRYHSGPIAGGEVPAMTAVPALFLVGGKDTATGAPGGWTRPGLDGARALWAFGRSGHAPWTFALDPEADHASPAALERSLTLTIPWIAAVVRQRIGPDGKVSEIDDRSGWTGNIETGDVVRGNSATNDSWLPDEESVKAWRALRPAGR